MAIPSPINQGFLDCVSEANKRLHRANDCRWNVALEIVDGQWQAALVDCAWYSPRQIKVVNRASGLTAALAIRDALFYLHDGGWLVTNSVVCVLEQRAGNSYCWVWFNPVWETPMFHRAGIVEEEFAAIW